MDTEYMNCASVLVRYLLANIYPLVEGR